MAQLLAGRLRLGGFEIDLNSGELWLAGTADGGAKNLLREQPFQVLRILVEASGKIVTREEIKKRLWPNDTLVDSDHNLNVAIGILRRALGDSADSPKYIQTLARRGYRLLVAAEWLEPSEPRREPAGTQVFPGPGGAISRSRWRITLGFGSVSGALVAA